MCLEKSSMPVWDSTNITTKGFRNVDSAGVDTSSPAEGRITFPNPSEHIYSKRPGSNQLNSTDPGTNRKHLAYQ